MVSVSRLMWYFYVLYSLIMVYLLASPSVEEFYIFSFAGVPPLALFFGKVMVLNRVNTP